MLIIREEQIDALREAAMDSFKARMMAHLKIFFPEECQRAGDERIRGAIVQGVFRAGKYGIKSERDVARYIDLSVVLGLDFDSGKRYGWAKYILEREDLNAGGKLDALLEQTRLVQSRKKQYA